MNKPIRVFFSELSRRIYATRAYRIEENGLVTVTGEKFDVTDDIGWLIEKYGIEFNPARPAAPQEETLAK